MHFAHKNSDNLFFRRISRGLCSTLITIKTAETQKNILYVYLSLFLPLLSERENYKRFTTSLLRRVGKAYTQSFNLDLGSFHTIASEALEERVRRTIVFQSRKIKEVFYISNLSETILYDRTFSTDKGNTPVDFRRNILREILRELSTVRL